MKRLPETENNNARPEELSEDIVLDAIPVDARDGLIDINEPDGSFGRYTWYVRFAPFSEDEAKVAADGITKSTGRRTTVASSGREVFVLVMDHPSRVSESTHKHGIRNMKRIDKSKNLVKEGAGAGYTVHIKGLKTGKILNMQKKGKNPSDEYYEVEVEVLPCEVEVGAEDYYNDFFWQEHEWGDTPTAQVDGGVVNVVFTWYEDEDEIRQEIENTELDFDFDYGWGWSHSDLPRDKPINSDHIKTKTDNYYEIFEIKLNAPDLADAVNCGFKSLDDRDEEDGETEDDVVTESYNDEWVEVGAAFDEFRQRLWKYTRKDRESRMEFFMDCMKKCEEAFKEYHDACVAED